AAVVIGTGPPAPRGGRKRTSHTHLVANSSKRAKACQFGLLYRLPGFSTQMQVLVGGGPKKGRRIPPSSPMNFRPISSRRPGADRAVSSLPPLRGFTLSLLEPNLPSSFPEAAGWRPGTGQIEGRFCPRLATAVCASAEFYGPSACGESL